MKNNTFNILLFLLIIFSSLFAQDLDNGKFTIARLQYVGGGDWYSDPSSLPNLLEFVGQNTNIHVNQQEKRVSIMDNDFASYPYLYMTGHGNVKFNESEVERLRQYLESGGFLHADDNYGMDKSFRREMKKIFPNKELVELPYNHEIFHCYYEFPNGLPKIHEHDNKAPQGLGIFLDGRLVVFYTFETDLGVMAGNRKMYTMTLQKNIRLH